MIAIVTSDQADCAEATGFTRHKGGGLSTIEGFLLFCFCFWGHGCFCRLVLMVVMDERARADPSPKAESETGRLVGCGSAANSARWSTLENRPIVLADTVLRQR